MKPTYEELLDTLFDVTQALHNTLVQGGQMTSADKDQRWTITHKAESIAAPAGTLTIGNSRSAADLYRAAVPAWRCGARRRGRRGRRRTRWRSGSYHRYGPASATRRAGKKTYCNVPFRCAFMPPRARLCWGYFSSRDGRRNVPKPR